MTPDLKMSAFFELTPDLVCIAGRNGFFKKVNQAVITTLGYTEPELMAVPISTFIHPEDKQSTAFHRTELLNGKPLVNYHNRYMAKSGDIRWLHWTSIYFPDQEIVFAIAKDITGQKQMELEIEEKYRKFKGLTSHFKNSIEEDRKYWANELQEELAQLASVLIADVEWIKNNAFELSPTSQSKIEHAAVISQLLVKTIRRVSFSISPNMLENLGLSATLEWYCKEFSILNTIPCHFESRCTEGGLTDEVRTDLFRICQEALTNTSKHARASEVWVAVEDAGGEIFLLIRDDGKGFDVEEQKQNSGLTRMQKRASSIGGQLTIESAPGKGTRVFVRIPKGSGRV